MPNQSNQNRPLLSIIITCYNLGKYLEQAIDSCPVSNLFEIVVVNDGSNDAETIEILRTLKKTKLHVKFVDQKNMGLASARNVGIENSRGILILPLDADNYLTDSFKEQFEANILDLFTKHNSVDVYYTDRYIHNSEERIKSKPFAPLDLVDANYIDACAIFKRSIFLKTDGYQQIGNIAGTEDWLLWLNFLKNGAQFYYNSSPIFHYRVRPNSMIRRVNYDSKDFYSYLIQMREIQFKVLDSISKSSQILGVEERRMKIDYRIAIHGIKHGPYLKSIILYSQLIGYNESSFFSNFKQIARLSFYRMKNLVRVN